MLSLYHFHPSARKVIFVFNFACVWNMFEDLMYDVNFSLFTPFCRNQSQNKEYLNAIEDLRGNINSKKFSDIRTVGLIATEIIENQSNDSANTKGNICSIIRLFYNECFLLTLENIWNF